ncbi:THxN family PEP-CTERM protein [Undibacterium sp.]|jgi:hypothetical protein|uniref:THxN family PEP-CTERM protein n=1 Tax=Undibacterium sp. TaxID=1914977 RepID=UPI002BE1FF63|nr:THxN family PEP-CTERM protein [Undibacterium sp.]HTD03170.1 THxN family PEP-CTERM protein [Undibacterium sp.]
MKKILGILGALACLFSAATAIAGPVVTQWSFNESLAWVTSGGLAPTFSSTGGTQDVTPTLLSWGSSSGSLDPAVNPNRSGVGITNAAVSGLVNTNGATATTNTITHYNNPISSSFGTLLTANLLNMLTLTPTLPAPNSPFGPTSIDFMIHFRETPNSAPCGFPSVSICDDIFVIDLGTLNNSFVYDGNTYFISILNLTNNLLTLPNATCAAAGAPNGCIGFTTQEGAATPTQFGFKITSQPVTIPEPGELALLAVGLLGLYFVRERKSLKL